MDLVTTQSGNGNPGQSHIGRHLTNNILEGSFVARLEIQGFDRYNMDVKKCVGEIFEAFCNLERMGRIVLERMDGGSICIAIYYAPSLQKAIKGIVGRWKSFFIREL